MNFHLIAIVLFILLEAGAAINAKVGSLNLQAAGLFFFGLSLVL